MADLLALSSRIIDAGVYEGPGSVNRVTTELSEVADGIAVVEAFSHVVAFRTSAGLALFDASLEVFADGILKSLRAWSEAPIHSLAYTHGHIDHVGGAHARLMDPSQIADALVRVITTGKTGEAWVCLLDRDHQVHHFARIDGLGQAG